MKELVFPLLLLFFINVDMYAVEKSTDPIELIREVSSMKAAKLSDYNSAFLEKTLYFSKRSRIVGFDTKALESDKAFTITPFKDIGPLLVVPSTHPSGATHAMRKDWGVLWNGKIDNRARFVNRKLPDSEILSGSFTVSMFGYDMDVNGNASISLDNIYKHNPIWEINDSNVAELPKPKKGHDFVVGAPPKTAEEIEHHKRLKSLNRKVFYSVMSNFVLYDFDRRVNTKYRIVPLELTPKYSVIFEIDNEKLFPRQYDASYDKNGDPIELELTTAEKDKKDRYLGFKAQMKLRDEPNKAVVGDIE